MEESSCTKYFKQKQSEDELFKSYVEVRRECGGNFHDIIVTVIFSLFKLCPIFSLHMYSGVKIVQNASD